MKLDEDVAVELAMVEDEINEVVAPADADLLLPVLEAEALAQLEQEVLQVVDEGRFQIVHVCAPP